MKQNVIIDRLRGVSVLAVVCMHYTFFFKNVLTMLEPALGTGYYGVTAFFCTSGFLITTNLLKRYGQVSGVSLRAFYVMRFGRIVPPLALLFLTLATLSMTAIPEFRFSAPLTLKDTLISAVTLQSNLYIQRGGIDMPMWAILWSLSIEEIDFIGGSKAAVKEPRSGGFLRRLDG